MQFPKKIVIITKNDKLIFVFYAKYYIKRAITYSTKFFFAVTQCCYQFLKFYTNQNIFNLVLTRKPSNFK